MILWPIAIFSTLSICTGVVMFVQAFRNLHTRRLIQNTPTARIRSLAMGLVEVNGTVSSRSTITAPFSGQPCAYWEVDIGVQGRQGWTTVHRNTSGHPFFVTDDTGTALVYPKGSVCRAPRLREESCAGMSLPSCYSRYLSEQGLWMRFLWRLGAMRFRERVIDGGERVYVLGTAEPRTQAFEVSHPGEMLATGTCGRVAVGPQPEVAAVIRRGTYEPTFIISSESELALTTTLALGTLGQLAAGPLLVLVGLICGLSSFDP